MNRCEEKKKESAGIQDARHFFLLINRSKKREGEMMMNMN